MSDYSDTVLVNDSGSESARSDRAVASSSPENQTSRPPAPSRASTFGPKCWICMSDTTEDDPNNPPVWRSPCTCSLVAHEACLLDWVADLENPKNKNKIAGPIQCPQCKSEIKISRPRSYVVDAYRQIDRSLGKFVLPGLGLSLVGTVGAGAWWHGFQSVYMVFGREDATRIFKYALQRTEISWAYGLIPLNLILARTDYADFVLPGSSLILLSTQLTDKFVIDYTMWPPLPSTVFACIPALRSIYNWCYHKTFCDLNRKWLAEVQPSHVQQGEGDMENDENNQAGQEAAEGDMVLEIEIGNGEGDVDGEVLADAAVDGANAQGQADNGHVHRILGRHDLLDGSGSLGQSVMGALIFPAVAAGMGNLLALALPTSWLTYRSYTSGRPGLLSTKWGRSVVGGGLFVVLKDALLLYCRWKLAQGHRQRRIMDFDKRTKKYSV